MTHFNAHRIVTLNCGLGRDSLVMLALLVEGELIAQGRQIGPEDIDCVVFSDTGAEWPHTMAMLDAVRDMCYDHDIRFVMLRKPPAELCQTWEQTKEHAWITDRWPTIEEKAGAGAYHLRAQVFADYRSRQTVVSLGKGDCTDNHKIQPIRRLINDLSVERFGKNNRQWSAAVRNGEAVPHITLIGYAADEANRIKAPKNAPKFVTERFPLVEMGITKADEQPILERHDLGHARKSGCYGCPFQPASWFWALKQTQPDRFAELVDYENEALEKNPKMFVTGRKPLQQFVDNWRAKNPDATIDAVLDKEYGRGCEALKAIREERKAEAKAEANLEPTSSTKGSSQTTDTQIWPHDAEKVDSNRPVVRIGLPYSSKGALLDEALANGGAILISAGSLRRKGKHGKYWSKIGDAAWHANASLDSAGFVAMLQGGYSWTVDEYVDYVVRNGRGTDDNVLKDFPWAWWSAMDYCCEEEIAADRTEVERRVQMTVSSYRQTMECLTWWRNEGDNTTPDPMPILQGRIASDYLTCFAELAKVFTEQKMDTPSLMGLGSVCRRDLHGPEGLLTILEALDAELPDNVKLHLFGVKGDALPHLVKRFSHRVASIDSMAWDFRARKEARAARISNTVEHRAAWMRHWVESQNAKIEGALAETRRRVQEETTGLVPKAWWKGATVRHPVHHSGVLKSFDVDQDAAIIRCTISCKHEKVKLSDLTLCPILVQLHGAPELADDDSEEDSADADLTNQAWADDDGDPARCACCGTHWLYDDLTLYGCDIHFEPDAGDAYLAWRGCCEAQHEAVLRWGFTDAYGLSVAEIAKMIAPEYDVLEVTEGPDAEVVCRLSLRNPTLVRTDRDDKHGNHGAKSPKGWRDHVFARVDDKHRHHDAPTSYKFGLSLFNGPVEVAVAVVGRPGSRKLQEAQPHTLEVTRVATWGHAELRKNASTKLYAAACKQARALGYDRMITYTLALEESGHSLRAAGWTPTRVTKPESWNRSKRPREDKAPTVEKIRWERGLTNKTKRLVRELDITDKLDDKLAAVRARREARTDQMVA